MASVSCSYGIGHLNDIRVYYGEEKELQIKIYLGKDEVKIVPLTKENIESVDVICATSEWIKYAICLKDGERYFVTFGAIDRDSRGDFKIPGNLLCFERLMADFIYREKVAIGGFVGDSKSSSAPPATRNKKKTPVVEKEDKPAQKQEEPVQETKGEFEQKETAGEIKGEFEQEYLFALDMINRRSYNVAYNTLSKLKGYKNADELLKEIEDKI